LDGKWWSDVVNVLMCIPVTAQVVEGGRLVAGQIGLMDRLW